MKTPIFVMENPNFMGLPTDEGQSRRKILEGERSTEVRFNSLYVHGELSHECGYDIAPLAAGDVRNRDAQRVVVMDRELRKHRAILVSVLLDATGGSAAYGERTGRYGLIVHRGEARKTLEYLQKKKSEALKVGSKRISL